MLKHLKCRFYIGGLSFCLPDNLYLNDRSEVALKNGFELVSKDRAVTLMILAVDTPTTAQNSIAELFAGDHFSFEAIGPVESVVFDGIRGYLTAYTGADSLNPECALELPDQSEHPVLTVWAKIDRTAETAAEQHMTDAFHAVLDSIRKSN